MRPSVKVDECSEFECPDCGARTRNPDSRECADCGVLLVNLGQCRDL